MREQSMLVRVRVDTAECKSRACVVAVTGEKWPNSRGLPRRGISRKAVNNYSRMAGACSGRACRNNSPVLYATPAVWVVACILPPAASVGACWRCGRLRLLRAEHWPWPTESVRKYWPTSLPTPGCQGRIGGENKTVLRSTT